MKSKEEWTKLFSKAKHGHILWDGNHPDPKNPIHVHRKSHETVNNLSRFGFFQEGASVLDLGCGNGRLCVALTEKAIKCYVGMDAMKESIDFCKETFADYAKRFAFKHMDVYNEYANPKGSVQPEHMSLPFTDEAFDNIVVYSVFTHLQNLPAASRYMSELRRVLKKGGKLFTTWYRSPPNPATTEVGRTVYPEWEIMTLLSGLKFDYTYGGHSPDFFDQWGVVATKP